MDKDGWPVKRMSGDYLAFAFPYGARALMAEREKVQKVLALSLQMNCGWRHNHDEPVFKTPLSFHEGFVRSGAERIALTDRVRTYHNFNWKRDVCQKPHINRGEAGITASDRHYARLIEILLDLQALTEELKPETLALIASCASANELQLAMLNACE